MNPVIQIPVRLREYREEQKPRILPTLKETAWLVFIGACCGALVGWLLVAWMMYDPSW